ncbi:MAG: hemerythrin domain-containing protein [Actinomycetes bacterium]
MPDIFSVLTQDHEEVKTMLTTLETGGGSHPQIAAEGHLEQRGDLVEKLIMEESRHEAAEEQYFWPTVRDKLANGDQLATTAIEQENEGKKVLDQLRKTSPDNVEFESLVATFIQAGREHIAFEEQQVWPVLRSALTPDEATALGEQFELAKKLGPTRPHPHTPANATVLKTAGMAAAMVDKAADAITGRGKKNE